MRAGLLRNRVSGFITRYRMAEGGRLVVVAVSGGADSVCLLHLLTGQGCRVVVAHLNHGMRGRAGDADAAFVRELSERLGHRCVVERRDVPSLRRERALSLEEAAREARYEFLRAVAEREGAEAIFLGHTADDQVETFLMRLIRGAGLAGLSAMRSKQGILYRPLLSVWRTEVEDYLRERGLEWREDASNLDPRFFRNRVRHELMPLLVRLNPGVKEVLLRETRLLARRQGRIEAEL
ncbi:MAG: tRNA lysidine(34) synthetase TilS, partial [Chloroflexota bacterium]|nr:tRNA lysidine(34) synthetase TilS [Chloroflexota bacterium]